MSAADIIAATKASQERLTDSDIYALSTLTKQYAAMHEAHAKDPTAPRVGGPRGPNNEVAIDVMALSEHMRVALRKEGFTVNGPYANSKQVFMYIHNGGAIRWPHGKDCM